MLSGPFALVHTHFIWRNLKELKEERYSRILQIRYMSVKVTKKLIQFGDTN